MVFIETELAQPDNTLKTKTIRQAALAQGCANDKLRAIIFLYFPTTGSQNQE